MRYYKVTIRYRPHFNSLRSETREIIVRATNKESAIFLAGFKLEGESILNDSLVIEKVERKGSA